MEVIRLVPIPVAHLIHHKQTLALFCGILPFAMAAEIGVWAVPLTAFVSFTLYGIEGIAALYEDPFGRIAKSNIDIDDIVEDARQEVEVLLFAWQTQGKTGGEDSGLFRSKYSKSAFASVCVSPSLLGFVS
jgi:putative membrane protein